MSKTKFLAAVIMTILLLPGCGVYVGTSPSSSQGTPVDNQNASLQQQVLGAPRNLSAPIIGNDSIELIWSPVTGADGYNVYLSGQKYTHTDQTNVTISNLAEATNYTLYVTATNSARESQPSMSITVRTALSWDTIHTMYANSVVLISIYPSILGVLGGQIKGTGWFAPGGYIVTNYHVVSKAHYYIDITLQTGQVYHAHVVKTDQTHDLAVLQLDNAWEGPALVLGDSDNIRVGEAVGVMGHPGGEALTLTNGTITGLHVTGSIQGYGSITDMFTYNAGAVGGDSGSPVFDQQGHVIGIEEGAGINNGNFDLAVPVNYLKALLY